MPQATANTSLSTIATNTTGAATSANQATANTSLSTIATNTTGVATAANQTTANTTAAETHSTAGSAPTKTEGVQSIDTSGHVVDPTLPLQIYQSDSYANITGNATTVVKSGTGTLTRICINTKGASANTAVIYDATSGSGTKIGTLDTTSTVGCQNYGLAFGVGLTIVTATGTAPDLTVVYR